MEFTLEQQVIHQLLLRSSIERDIGLYNGKMGLILFFYHYFKANNKAVFEDTANELMEELEEDIHVGLTISFSSGLSGIGWGIEYLIQNNFVEGDSLEVCEEIDKKIMEKDPRRITDYSLETGLEGLLHYVLAHIKGVMAQHSKLPFDEIYLKDLYQAASIIPGNSELSEDFKNVSRQYLHFYDTGMGFNYSFKLPSFIEVLKIDKEKLAEFPLGLKNGLSGYMLKNYKF